MSHRFPSPNARVWHAYYSLDRDEKGEPPAIRELERVYQLTHGLLNKLLKGTAYLERTNATRTMRLAEALGTTMDWLLFEHGKPPQGSWQVPRWPGPKKKTKSGTIPAVKAQK